MQLLFGSYCFLKNIVAKFTNLSKKVIVFIYKFEFTTHKILSTLEEIIFVIRVKLQCL